MKYIFPASSIYLVNILLPSLTPKSHNSGALEDTEFISRAQMEESLPRLMAEPVGPARRLEPVVEGVEEAFWLLNGKQGQPPAVRKGEEALEV